MAEPIRTPQTTVVLSGEHLGMPNLPCERRKINGYPAVVTTWALTPGERLAIAEGANIKVALITPTPHPPISVAVVQELVDVTPADWGLDT